MIIKQVSVNIENRAGASWKVFQTLADSNINILSYSIEDAPEHGTLRLLTDNTVKAGQLLRKEGFQLRLIDVYAMNVPNETGSMSHVLRHLTEQDISVDFMYAFQYKGISQTVIHADDMNKLERVLTEYEIKQLAR